ncbi:MAG TPA: aromatic ring-hydroxylating dioxygenase subunit alpha [Pararobbsia sp.]|nr:aromatic ring-hydroxylating dioxygenase subunit alpha [Pararobbsia sp.]
MSTWNPALYRSWFVVAQSRRVQRTPLSVTLLDRRWVIARLQSGELLALDDCCPHRHVPLSMGRVTPAGLQCCYHGWTFDAHGRCTAVPGLTPQACMPTVRVAAAQVIERDGLIWLKADAQDEVGSSTLPAFISGLPADGHRFSWRSTWNARAVDALENFLDPMHTHFIHPGLVRREGERQSIKATVTRSEGALQVDYDGQPQQNGLLYRLFESPRAGERAHFSAAAAGSAQLEYRYKNGSALFFTLHFSPESEAVTRVYGTFHVENRWAPRWAVRMFAWPFLLRVVRQDQRVVEVQAANRAHFGRGAGLSTELDLVRPSLDEVWSLRSHPPGNQTRRVEIML